ncbi:hypothetical protein [Actinoplanes sp. NPDC051411]|uniref:hypothetical protein n=1 Tax=Actinoplanes sp. NPDC051411 TaxID=3155522 RepID=UPI003437E8D6
MSTKPRALAHRGAQALTAAAVVAGGLVLATPAHATLPLPTITSVSVAGSPANKVVSTGTSIEITGTGFTGMVDNAADSGCNTAAVAYPAAGSSCSQVRFLGALANATTGFTLATRYSVISDTKIIASVPSIAPGSGALAGNPALGTGSVKVQVVNTSATGTSSGISASAASEVFYRAPLVANYVGTVSANPAGGGNLVVPVTGLPSGSTSASFLLEKVTGYVYSVVSGSPTIASTAVTWNDANSVNLTVPPGSPAGDFIGIMVVHDGIAGTADVNALKYPAIITKVQSCSGTVATAVDTWVTAINASAGTQSGTLPDCTGGANVSGTAADVNYIKITGKGFTGGTGWNVDGTAGATGGVTEVCGVASDTVAYCKLTVATAPADGISAVSFAPAAVGSSSAPTLIPTGGAILIWNTLI